MSGAIFKQEYVDYLDSFKNIGIKPYEEKETRLRKKVGDRVSVHLLRDILFSTLYLSPKKYVPFVYSWGKFVGIQSARQALHTLNIELITKLFVLAERMNILEKEFYRDTFSKAWIQIGYGYPSFVYIDSKNETMRIRNDECAESYRLPNIGKKICFFERGILAGVFERVFNVPTNATETKCNASGHDQCETLVELNTEFPQMEIYNSKYFKRIRDFNADMMTNEELLRERMGNYTSITIFQVTYLGMWLSSSGSHTLLYWIGRETGSRLKRKMSKNDLDRFLEQMKVGVVKKTAKSVIVEECAFCYGSKNLHKSICSYLAGMISGILSKKKSVNVIETKCIANGDSVCEFKTV